MWNSESLDFPLFYYFLLRSLEQAAKVIGFYMNLDKTEFMFFMVVPSHQMASLWNYLILFTQPLRSGRIWHKVKFLSGV